MSTLSLCMIVRNEEEIIARCLDSVQEACDEIIICDTGSTDKTVEIVSKYPQVKVVHFTWVDDFAAARNFSFEHATKDLIMWLDADDIVKSKDLAILKSIKNRPLDTLPECLTGLYQYCHDHNDNVTISLSRERIFKRSSNPKWKYKIHECVPLGMFKSYERIDFEVHHYKTESQYVRQEGRNLRIMKKCLDNPAETCARYEFYYGKECAESGQLEEAEKYLKAYLKHWEFYEDAFFATFKLAEIEFNKRNFDAAASYCFDALKLDQRRADLYCFLGLIYVNKERWDLSKFWYEAALNMPKPEDSLGFFDMKYHTWIPHFQLSYIFHNRKEYKQALFHVNECLKHNPNFGQALYNKRLLEETLAPPEQKKPKVAIFIPFKYDSTNPNVRIRKLNIRDELYRQGYRCDIVSNFTDLLQYDYILSHGLFNPIELDILKREGKIIGYDLAEGCFDDNFKSLKDYSVVFCSSSKLKDEAFRYNLNATHLPDSYEV